MQDARAWSAARQYSVLKVVNAVNWHVWSYHFRFAVLECRNGRMSRFFWLNSIPLRWASLFETRNAFLRFTGGG